MAKFGKWHCLNTSMWLYWVNDITSIPALSLCAAVGGNSLSSAVWASGVLPHDSFTVGSGWAGFGLNLIPSLFLKSYNISSINKKENCTSYHKKQPSDCVGGEKCIILMLSCAQMWSWEHSVQTYMPARLCCACRVLNLAHSRAK